jgi:serine/threonine protein kinase/tetratricopeptide (TPR) repeat protein
VDKDKTPPESLETTDASELEDKLSRRIGNYRILQKVGEGGMGEVYEAEQEQPVRRRVALKVIKHGMDTKQVVARFEAERQALAMMDHPSVAKVFEAGATPRGRPYFVMEFVRGVPLTEHCDRQKLPVRERLGLFLQVCEGVQHAHQNAIIHRDLKPSNVLVSIQDGRAVPKIIDFGVAKATTHKLTEKTMFTELGALVGTPEYMSPEQAEGTGQSVDTRTDVYSLGVMLYELLVGTLPFDPKELRSGGYEGIRKKIREDEPPKPSTRLSTLDDGSTESAKSRCMDLPGLQRQLRGDLDWITMRALEKDRTRRYGSAADLAADLLRHLHNEPVLASPPSAAYRTRKFVRRHRLGVGIVATLILLLAGFTAAMVVQAGRIARERDRANREAQRANAEARAAGEVTEFLVDSFELVDPMDARGDSITAREVLEQGAQRIDRELQEQPLLRAQIMDAIGRVYQGLGRDDRAEELLRGALELRMSELGERHVDTARSMSTLGSLGEGAPGLVKKALSIQEELLGDHADTAWSLYRLAWLEHSSDLVKYRERLERARAIFESPSGSDPKGASWCLQNLGMSYGEMGDYAGALEYFQRAFEIKKRILPPDHSDLAISLNGIGLAKVYLKDYEGARLLLERAVSIHTGAVGPDNLLTADALHSLGDLLVNMEEYTEARPHLERALEIVKATLKDEDHGLAAWILHSLATLERETGQHAEAESLYRRALKMRENLDPDHPQVAETLEGFADLLHKMGREPEAERLKERARAIRADVEPQKNTN